MAVLSRPERQIHFSDRVPFEIWRDIFQIIFSVETHISHPPSKYELSPLHSRLNVYRCLALVSQRWRINAQGVFFEELEANTAESIKGIIDSIHRDKEIASAITSISFSFYEFRCSMSTPRRPRKLLPPVDVEDEVTRAIRRKAHAYRPSIPGQAGHWRSWHSLLSLLLHSCKSIAHVSISFTSDHSARGLARTSSYYPTLFPLPDLGNQGILEGLVALKNLRTLTLVDPSPLADYGPSMAAWERLHTFSITISRSFNELSETSFIPPRNLTSFTFHDLTQGNIPWPLASDLGRCTNLRYLNLGVVSLRNPITTEAIAFLVRVYQSTLVELTLDLLERGRVQTSFEPIFGKEPVVHFSRLETLRLLNGYYESSIFLNIRADTLRTVEVDRLDYGMNQTDVNKWRKTLCTPSLKGLKTLKIHMMETAVFDIVSKLCEELDIDVAARELGGH